MAVIITYCRSTRHEAADQLRRAFAARGYENIQVVYSSDEQVEMPSGRVLTWSEAANYLGAQDNSVPIQFITLPHGEGLDMPAYETAQAAGMDMRAAIDAPLTIPPGRTAVIPTGFNLAIPAGYEIQVRSRSGLAAKHGVCVLNAPGTIDADYRGEIKAILFNAGEEPFVIQRGDRVCQAVLAPVIQGRWVEAESLPETARGQGGFGSTGRF